MKTSDKKKSIKKRIQDLKRTMQHTTDPESLTQKKAYLKKLKTLKRLAIKKQHLITKYKNIRFFERRKLERRLRKVLKALQVEDTPELQAQKAQLTHDIDYIKHYPLNMKYISLLVDNVDEASYEREVMREQIQNIMAKKQQKRLKSLEDDEQVGTIENDDFFTEEDGQKAGFKQQIRAGRRFGEDDGKRTKRMKPMKSERPPPRRAAPPDPEPVVSKPKIHIKFE